MIDIRRILCPVDFSDCSRLALDHAVAIAKWYASTVTLLHVSPPVPISAYATGASMMSSSPAGGEDQNEVLEAMKRFSATLDGLGVPLELASSEGDAAQEIVANAAAADSDLIVMGTHGRSGFQRLVLGSVTEKVLRKAGSPVLTVPPRLVDAASTPQAVFKRILCAVDFSDCSMRALDYAMSLAQESNSALTVLHVIEPLPATAIDRHEVAVADYTMKDYVAAATEQSRAKLATAIPDHVREFCQVDTVQSLGTPYREILRVAADEASDVIVIGVHGRGVVDLFFFGSTAQHVVRQAACPVLTMRT